jgi:hypothetical protein
MEISMSDQDIGAASDFEPEGNVDLSTHPATFSLMKRASRQI